LLSLFVLLNETAEDPSFVGIPVPADNILEEGIGNTGNEEWQVFPDIIDGRTLRGVPQFLRNIPIEKAFCIHTSGGS
jgi:hypothetical protein